MASTMATTAGLALILGWLVAGSAVAQSPAVSPQAADYAKQQQQQQAEQPLNNQPVWKEVRSGLPQVTTVKGRETDVLIQPQGQTWRAARVPIATVGGLLVAAVLAILAVMHIARGSIKSEAVPGARLIQRFEPADRWAHWLLAITWVICAITGLILSLGKWLLLPLLGYSLFSLLASVAKSLHNFLGPILVVAVPWAFARFLRSNILQADDLRWFAHMREYFRGHEYPSGKFNGGEKVHFWLALLMSLVLVASGLILVFPNFDQTRATMQWANIVHMVTAYFAIAAGCTHIYLGTVGVDGALRGMKEGYVDETWAEHHHARWYQDVVAGKAREKFVDVADAASSVASSRPVSTPESVGRSA